MDTWQLLDFKNENGTLKGFPSAEEITNEELLELAMLFPAALENVITRENAPRIRCKNEPQKRSAPETLRLHASRGPCSRSLQTDRLGVKLKSKWKSKGKFRKAKVKTNLIF